MCDSGDASNRFSPSEQAICRFVDKNVVANSTHLQRHSANVNSVTGSKIMH